MNTSRYNKSMSGEAKALVERTANSVRPSAYYSEYYAGGGAYSQGADDTPGKGACGAEYESEAAKKLDTLLKKSYTVVAQEDGALYGLASMDRQGNVGMLYAGGESPKRTAKLLIRALERLAEKKQVGAISVTACDGAEKIFKECGYSLCENSGKSLAGGDASLFTKQITAPPPTVEFPPESALRYTLDPKKPITVAGKTSLFPAVFFGTACFFVMLLTVLGVAYKRGSENVYGGENIPLFAVIVGLIFAAALTILILYIVRYYKLKKGVLSGLVTSGVITDLHYDVYWTYDNDGDSHRNVRVDLTYAFYDENMNLRTGTFTHKYQGRAPHHYPGEEVAVAYFGGNSYLLEKYTILDSVQAN